MERHQGDRAWGKTLENGSSDDWVVPFVLLSLFPAPRCAADSRFSVGRGRSLSRLSASLDVGVLVLVVNSPAVTTFTGNVSVCIYHFRFVASALHGGRLQSGVAWV